MNNDLELPEKQTEPSTVSPTTSRTRISTAWLLTVSLMLGLMLLLIFILQNLQSTAIHFFGFHWKIPLGVAMLLAAVVGGLLVALFGTARVIQLGRKLRRSNT